MKTRILYILPLLAVLALPGMAQLNPAGNSPADNQPPPAASTSPQISSTTSSDAANSAQNSQASSTAAPSSDENLSARQPLEPEYHQGFWGKLNPFARKKYVQNQLAPIRNRVNELDDLTATNSKAIKDVDARAQQGIQMADAKATQADMHATAAGNQAEQANQTATQASNRLNTVEQVVGNIDQYHAAAQTEIRFRPGQTALSVKAKQALDDMTSGLKDQKGYIIEVQGFSPSGVQSSQAMADSVVRYLVQKNEVPLYRIYTMGLGNAKLPATDDSGAKPAHSNRVEISLLKNDVEQLSASNQSATETGTQSGYSKSQSAQPSGKPNTNATPTNSKPPDE